jgi:hypothetical protein
MCFGQDSETQHQRRDLVLPDVRLDPRLLEEVGDLYRSKTPQKGDFPVEYSRMWGCDLLTQRFANGWLFFCKDSSCGEKGVWLKISRNAQSICTSWTIDPIDALVLNIGQIFYI